MPHPVVQFSSAQQTQQWTRQDLVRVEHKTNN